MKRILVMVDNAEINCARAECEGKKESVEIDIVRSYFEGTGGRGRVGGGPGHGGRFCVDMSSSLQRIAIGSFGDG